MDVRGLTQVLLLCFLLPLLTSCKGERREPQAVYTAVLGSVLAELSKDNAVRQVVFVKIPEEKKNLKIPATNNFRLGDECLFDPIQGVIDQKTKERGLLLVMSRPEFIQNAAHLAVAIITNKSEDSTYWYSLQKSGGAWVVKSKSRKAIRSGLIDQ